MVSGIVNGYDNVIDVIAEAEKPAGDIHVTWSTVLDDTQMQAEHVDEMLQVLEQYHLRFLRRFFPLEPWFCRCFGLRM